MKIFSTIAVALILISLRTSAHAAAVANTGSQGVAEVLASDRLLRNAVMVQLGQHDLSTVTDALLAPRLLPTTLQLSPLQTTPLTTSQINEHMASQLNRLMLVHPESIPTGALAKGIPNMHEATFNDLKALANQLQSLPDAPESSALRQLVDAARMDFSSHGTQADVAGLNVAIERAFERLDVVNANLRVIKEIDDRQAAASSVSNAAKIEAIEDVGNEIQRVRRELGGAHGRSDVVRAAVDEALERLSALDTKIDSLKGMDSQKPSRPQAGEKDAASAARRSGAVAHVLQDPSVKQKKNAFTELRAALAAAKESLNGAVRRSEANALREMIGSNVEARRVAFLQASPKESRLPYPFVGPPAPPAAKRVASNDVMSRAALTEYVADKFEIDENIPAEHGGVGIAEVSFQAGDFRPEYLPQLREMGADVVYIPLSSPADLQKYTEADGYFLAPPQYRSVWPTQQTHEFISGFDPKKQADLTQELVDSDSVPLRLRRLTMALWRPFFKLYREEMLRKPAGAVFARPDFAEIADQKGRKIWSIFYHEAATHELLGGTNYGDWPERGMLWGHYAAYKPTAKEQTLNLALRGFVEGMNLARWLGLPVFSWGLDGVLRGFYRPWSLSSQKVNLGAEFYPEGVPRLVKIVNTHKFTLQKRNLGNGKQASDGLVLFGIPRGGELERRIVESMKDGAPPAPTHTLLGGNYFTDAILAPAEALVMNHFYTPDSSDLIPPKGMSAPVRRPLEFLNPKETPQ